MRVDDPRELLVAALQRHRRDQLGDHVAGAVADDVGAEQHGRGNGGGRPDFAQAGGKDPSRLDEALAMVHELVG